MYPTHTSHSLQKNFSVMESRLKMRISRMFRSSFGSCKPRNVTDAIERPVFVVETDPDSDHFNTHNPLYPIEPLTPKVQIFPSMCRPRLQEPFRNSNTKEVLRRRKVSDRGVYFISGEAEGRTCPPASPMSPMTSIFKLQEKERMRRRIRNKSKKPQKPEKKKKERCGMSLSFSSGGDGWFTSEEETADETETFFSSKSFSSDSSESRNKASSRRRRDMRRSSDMGITPLVTEGKVVEESFAVVKHSKDPYSDFRTSMVEMIVEKQLFSAKDLEKLLQCFLSLNSAHHHRVIVEVFTEIWEALFTN